MNKHGLISIYSCILLLILNGLIWTSGFNYVLYYFLFIISLGLFYFLFYRLRGLWNSHLIQERSKIFRLNEKHLWVILTGLGLFIIAHLWELSGSPLIHALQSMDYYEIVNIRKEITAEHSFYWNYGLNFSLKAFIPFFLLLLYIRKQKRLFYIVLIISVFYALSLIQKSFIVTIFLPLIVYALYKRNWRHSIAFFMIIFSGIVCLYVATNPVLRGGKPARSIIIAEEEGIRSKYRIVVIAHAVVKRVAIVPGEMVSEWFHNIPEKKPFLNGRGYRFLSPFFKDGYVSYSLELYPVIKPKYAEKGIKGSVNAASFMYEYANFGLLGLVFSGFLLAFLFNTVEWFFNDQMLIKLSLNVFPMLMLSSTALSTLLLTGGWILIILLFILFGHFFETELKND